MRNPRPSSCPARIGFAVFAALAIAPRVMAATAVVPRDFATIQEAVTAVESDLDPGVVFIQSSATFDEVVRIGRSVTLRAGLDRSPVIERTSGFASPIEIRALVNTDTTVVLRGLTVRSEGSEAGFGPNQVISISNAVADGTLSVRLEGLTVEGDAVQNAVTVASASVNGDIDLSVSDSRIQLVGAAAGSPSCLRLEPFGYNLTTTLTGNTFRFSRAAGIDISGGRDDVSNVTTIDRNRFEGFESLSGAPRAGIDIRGTSSGEIDDESATETTLTNNLFSRVGVGLSINGQSRHVHTVYANNNTVVESGSSGVEVFAFGDSTLNVALANNILWGSASFGLNIESFPPAAVVQDNTANLLFKNADGAYGGSAAPGFGDLLISPEFLDPDGDDYRLSFGSPAVDAGNDQPLGGIGGLDLDGLDRFQDGNLDGAVRIDLGAFEAPAACREGGPDGDGDGTPDRCDNCVEVANVFQLDGDEDGYGNACDGDFNQHLPIVGFPDLVQMRDALGKSRDSFDCLQDDGSPGASCLEFDLDESLPIIGFPDLARFRELLGQPPGPKCGACPLPPPG